MKYKEIQTGWVITYSNTKYILDFTYSQKRTDAIKKFMEIWVKPSTWQAFKKRGYKCVKAKMTINID